MYIKHFPGHVKLYDIGHRGGLWIYVRAYKYMYIMGYINTSPSYIFSVIIYKHSI